MRKSVQALCAVALAMPFLAGPAAAKFEQTRVAPGVAAQPSNGILLVQAGPRAGGGGAVRGGGSVRGGGAFRGGGFRGGFRGDGFRGGRFRGGVFIGPSFGFYDPFYWPYSYGYPYYGYGYGYYPPVAVGDRGYDAPPPADYLPSAEGPPPEQSWYHCSNPDGFYPYVRTCEGRWEAVPVNPGPPPPER